MKKDCIVFEVGFEVVNKVGGIHTVLSSKASIMKNNLKDYFLIGPYIPRQAAVDFEDEPPSKEFRRVFDKLEKFGIKCYSGHWIVPGRPKCLLIDVEEYSKNTDEIKKEYWKNWKIDSLSSPKEFDERIAWSKATGILIDELTKEVFPKEKVIAHFHEWYSGAGLLHLKLANPKIKTVFTTHATRIGRSIANSGKNLYELVGNSLKKGVHFSDKQSRKYRLQAIHLIEKKSAKEADVFTTVSEITAIEAEYILGRKADLILPNGLDMEKFPFMEELSTLHLKYRNRIREFVIDYFAPYYYIDVRDTLFFFILGRCEFRNKGVDIFIDALGELNNRLKKSGLQRKVIAFIWTPIKTKGKNLEVLKHMAIYDRMEEEIDSEMSDIKERIFRFISMGMTPRGEELLDEEFKHTISKMLVELRSKNRKLPPISAFELEKGNEITKAIKKNNLSNKVNDNVKVIFYPAYLSSTDCLLSLDVYPAMMGSHLGVFPSYYEPWGYTPLEAATLGLQTVTSDLSGFGRYVKKKIGKKANGSIEIIEMEYRTYNQTVKQLTDIMEKIYCMNKKERGDKKIRAKKMSYLFDWNKLIKNYLKAYAIALKKK